MQNTPTIKKPISKKDFYDWYKNQFPQTNYEYMKIPRAVCTLPLSVNAKYLYGIFYGFIRQGKCTANNQYLMEQLNCSLSSLRKYLKELEKFRCIKIEVIDQYKRIITPLITEEIVLYSDREIEEHYNEYMQQFDKEPPQFFKDFYNSIK